MDDHVSVAVVHGRDDLLKETTSFAVLDLEDTILRTRLGYRCYEGTCGNGRGKVVQSLERVGHCSRLVVTSLGLCVAAFVRKGSRILYSTHFKLVIT